MKSKQSDLKIKKPKKPKNLTFQVFLKKPKKPRFFKMGLDSPDFYVPVFHFFIIHRYKNRLSSLLIIVHHCTFSITAH